MNVKLLLQNPAMPLETICVTAVEAAGIRDCGVDTGEKQ